MSEKSTDSPVKVGELVCTFKGLIIDMSNYTRMNGAMPLGQSNNDLAQSQHHRTTLNGIRAKPRSTGTENVMPKPPSRSNMESQLPAMPAPSAMVAVPQPTMAVTPALTLSPSANIITNGEWRSFFIGIDLFKTFVTIVQLNYCSVFIVDSSCKMFQDYDTIRCTILLPWFSSRWR